MCANWLSVITSKSWGWRPWPSTAQARYWRWHHAWNLRHLIVNQSLQKGFTVTGSLVESPTPPPELIKLLSQAQNVTYYCYVKDLVSMCWSTVAEVWWATVKFNQRSVNNQQFSVWKEATCSRVVAIFHLLVLHLLRHQAYKFIPHKSCAFARIMLDFIFRYMYFICYLSLFDSASTAKVRFCSISSFSRWSLVRPRPVNVNTVATLTGVLTNFVQ